MSLPAITEDARKAINDAVSDAESRTVAEIVPVIAESSGRYDRAEDICGLWLGLTAMTAVWILLPPPVREPGSWGGPSVLWYPVSLITSVIVGFIVGVVISHHLPALRRLFTPSRECHQEVENRSRQVFFDHRVHHTAGQNGVLLYVSLFEHRVAIVADQSVLDAITQPRVDQLCEDFTSRLKNGDLHQAFVDTIAELADLLAEKLPAKGDNRNELPDALVILQGM